VKPSNLPNLRRLFVEARTEAEESAYSRNAVSPSSHMMKCGALFLIYIVLQSRPLHVLGRGLQFSGAADEWWANDGEPVDFVTA